MALNDLKNYIRESNKPKEQSDVASRMTTASGRTAPPQISYTDGQTGKNVTAVLDTSTGRYVNLKAMRGVTEPEYKRSTEVFQRDRGEFESSSDYKAAMAKASDLSSAQAAKLDQQRRRSEQIRSNPTGVINSLSTDYNNVVDAYNEGRMDEAFAAERMQTLGRQSRDIAAQMRMNGIDESQNQDTFNYLRGISRDATAFHNAVNNPASDKPADTNSVAPVYAMLSTLSSEDEINEYLNSIGASALASDRKELSELVEHNRGQSRTVQQINIMNSAMSDDYKIQAIAAYDPALAQKLYGMSEDERKEEYRRQYQYGLMSLDEYDEALAKAEQNFYSYYTDHYDPSDPASVAEYEKLNAEHTWLLDNKDKAWTRSNDLKYSAVTKNEDFAKNSATDYSNRDPMYMYINNIGGVQDKEEGKDVYLRYGEGAASSPNPSAGLYEKYKNMTDEEVAMYNYLYKTKGKEAAEEYLTFAEYAINARNLEQTREEATDAANKNLVGASLDSVGKSTISGIGFLDAAVQKAGQVTSELFGGGIAAPVDYNTAAMQPSVYASTVLQVGAENLNKKYGMISSNEEDRGKPGVFFIDEKKNPLMARIFNGKGWGDVYQMGMSQLNSRAGAGLSYLVPGLGLITLASSAATNEMLNTVEKGGSDTQALAMGFFAGFAEYIMEKFPMDNLLHGDWTGNKLGSLIRQTLPEGFEEGGTSIINWAADAIIMARDSDYSQKADAYIANGMDEKTAKWRAFWDKVIEIGWDVAGGIAMGSMTGADRAGMQAVVDAKNIRTLKKSASIDTYRAITPDLVTRVLAETPNDKTALSIRTQMNEGGVESVKANDIYRLMLKNGDTVNQMLSSAAQVINESAAIVEKAEAMPVSVTRSAIDQVKAGTATNKTFEKILDAAKADPAIQAELKSLGVDITSVGGMTTAQKRAAVKTAIEGVAKQEIESEAKAAAEAQTRAVAAEEVVQTQAEPSIANANPTDAAEAAPTESVYSQSTQLAINAQRTGNSSQVSAFISKAVKSPTIMAELGVQRTGNNQKDRTAIKKRITELAAMPSTSAPTTTAAATTAKAAPARAASSSSTPALESYAQFADNYRKATPNATEAQIRAAYERKASSVARAGKTIRTGHGEMSFDQYREVMIADARAKGDTISEGDIMSWFDTRKAKQDSIRSKREPVLGAAVDHVNEAFKKHGFKYTVRLSFDAEDFPATKTQENAFVNHNTGEIVMNGWVISSEQILLKRLTHEIVHPGSRSDGELVNDIIKTFEELNAAGKLDGEAKKLVDNKEAAIRNRLNLYQRHENELAAKEGRDAQTITDADAREEFAADLMGEMFGATKLAQEVASYKPSLIAKIQKGLRKVIKAFGGDDTDNAVDAEVVEKIQAIESKLIDALKKRGENPDGIVNHSISSTAEAAGIQAVRDEKSGRITFLDGGVPIDKVTAEHIRDRSALGVLIKTALDNKFISSADAKIQFESAAEIMNMIMTTQDPDMVWQFVGASMFSAVKSNADGQYGTTVDFSTICRKTQDMITAMSHAMKKLGRGLTKDEVTQLQKKLIEEGTPVPCPVCYVFSRWAGIGAVLDKMALWQDKYADYDKQALADRIAELEKRSKAADLRKALKAEDDEYQKLNSEHEKLSRKLTGLRKQLKAAKGEEATSVKAQIDGTTLQRKYIKDQMNDIEDKARGELAWLKTVRTQDGYKAVPKDILYDLENAEAFASDEYALSWKYRTTRGPSAGKAILPYADMRVGDMILGVGKNSADGNDTFKVMKGELNDDQRKAVVKAIARTRAQNLIGGQRFQSTSDFRYDYALDYVLAFWEAQALGSNIQTYTKVIEFADMIAAIGGDVNLSVMPKDKGYKDGKLIFSNVTGINYEAALEANAKYDNAQLILVGINDEHIRLALEDNGETGGETIGFVIPYHASGASIEEFISALVSNLNEQFVKDNYVDYSDVQGDKARSNATEVQTRRRDLRKQILTGKHKAENEEGKTTSQSWTPTEADFELLVGESVDISNRSFEGLRAVEKKALAGDAEAIREYESWSAGVLKDLFNKLWDSNGSQYGVRLNSTQAASIMPHEYWNTNTTRTNAYVNGFIFRSYCYSMGLHPRFTGMNSKGKKVDHGDFSDSTGYWKTLIDRPMYRNDGTYRDQQAVNMSKFQKGMLTKEWAETHWGEFKVKEPNVSKATMAADKFVASTNKRSYSLSVESKDGRVEIVDGYDATKDSALNYLNAARQGSLDRYTYFPIMAHTPQTILNTMRQSGYDIDDRPLIMQAKKARNAQVEGKPYEFKGVKVHQHAVSAEKILEVLDNVNNPNLMVYETERKKKVTKGKRVMWVDADDRLCVLTTLKDNNEYAAIFEFYSQLAESNTEPDGALDEYHTTVTVFKPEVTKDGKPYDYGSFLLSIPTNIQLEVKKESSDEDSAISQYQATDSAKELSNSHDIKNSANVKRDFSLSSTDSEGNAGGDRSESEDATVSYSLSDPETLESEFNIEDRDILANLNPDRFTGVPKNILKNYQKVYGEWEAASEKLFALQSDKASPDEIAKARTEVEKLDKRLDDIEMQKAVQSILEGERVYIEQRTTLEDSQIAPEENRYNEEFESDITSNNAIRRDRLAEYYEMVNKYGAMSKGENPARDISVPRSTEKGNRVSRTVRTALESKITDLDTSVALQEEVQKGGFSYIPITDKDALEVAKKNLSGKTWGEARDDWNKKVGGGRFDKYDVAEGFYLYNTAIQNGDTEAAVDILTDLSARVREGAQMVQAVRILKKMSPDNRMYALTRSVRQLQEQINKQHGSKAPEIKIDQNLLDAYLNAETDEELDNAKANLYQSIAVQVPRTFMDKWNAWRYLSMLGNFKTIERNAIGNIANIPMVHAKNTIAWMMERFIPKEKRTKALMLEGDRKALRAYAAADYADVERQIQNTSKWADSAESSELAEAIREVKSTLTAPVIKQWQYLTNKAMNDSPIGDYGFLKYHYSVALSSVLAARGFTAEQVRNGEVSQDAMDSARAYAIREAQRATFRDLNAFSNAVKKMRFRGKSVGSMVGNIYIEGTNPFKSTPANVLVRAIEYGPVGILQGIYQITYGVKSGKYTTSEAMDRLAAGLTGTMLGVLGGIMSMAGIVKAHIDDDDERVGRQAYSLEIGGKSITLDWLAPAALPFFAGVSLVEAFKEDNDLTFVEAIVDAFSNLADPMLEMSMLSGVQNLLESMLYGEDGVDAAQIAYAIGITPVINYLSQAIPTLVSQLANTLEPTSGFTYTGDISGRFTKNLIRSLIRVTEKIPFVDIRQADYIDEWGRTEDNGNLLTRFVNNFFNPAYVSDVVITEADVELERLEEMTGTNVAPSRRGYTITVPSEDGTSSTKVKLDVEQYEAYSREYGTQAAMMMAALMSSDVYADMSDADRVKALQTVNQLADEFGKLAAGVGYQVKVGDSEKKLVDLTQTGLSIAEAYTSKLYHAKLDEDRDLKLNEKAALYLEWVEGQDWTSEQKAATLNAYGQFWSVVGSDTEKYQTFTSTTGLSSDDYLALNDAKETYADGAWSQAELTSYLSRTPYSRSQKAAIFDMTFPNAKNNPYK